MKTALSCLSLLLFLIPSSFSHHFDASNPFHPEDAWPSCDELRSVWLTLGRMAQHSVATNEIPIVPRDLLNYVFHHQRFAPLPGKPRHGGPVRQPFHVSGVSHPLFRNDLLKSMDSTSVSTKAQLITPTRKEHLQTPEIFNLNLDHIREPTSIHQARISPQESHSPTTIGFFGGFEDSGAFRRQDTGSDLPLLLVNEPLNERVSEQGNNLQSVVMARPLEDEILGIFGTGIHDGNEEQELNGDLWGPQEEAGTFGRFAPDKNDNVDPLLESRVLQNSQDFRWTGEPTDFRFELSMPQGLKQMTCKEMKTRACSRNEQCACVGWISLRCLDGTCQVLPESITSHLMDVGAWHDVPASQLGIVARNKRRSSRSTLL